MAVDPKSQKLAVAAGLIGKAGLLVQAYVEYQKYDLEYTKAGLSYLAGDFDGTSLAYVDPAQIATLITQLRAFKAWMDTASNGDVFFKVQPGT